jgi:acyl-CoA synthetase (AMP-forming)/AMP-acid ligase II
MSGAPLLRGFAPGAPIGWRDGQEIAWERFVASAVALSARLSGNAFCVNLCEDRLNFLLGFAAALMARSTSLLPQSHAPEATDTLARSYPGSVLITDGSYDGPPALPRIDVAEWPEAREATAVPEIPLAHAAVVAFTSGSTGAPRPHVKTWWSLTRAAAAVAARLPIVPGSAVLGVVPPQHMWGFETTVMLPLQVGCAVAAGCPLLPAEISAALQGLPAPRWLVATPLHLRACVSAAERLAPLAAIASAAAPLTPELATEVERRYGAPLFEVYGSTETGTLATRQPTHSPVFETVGGIALSTDQDRSVARGGHLAEPMPLNDVLELHGPTRFILHGRTQDLVKIAGKRASLAALNAELARVPGIEDGAVWLREDGGAAARVAAFVVAPGMDSRAILEHLRQRLDPVFLPRPLILVDALPRNRAGKLTHESLRELAATHGLSPRNEAGEWQSVAAGHPALPFHFPGDPVVPGVWLLSLVENAARERFGAHVAICGIPDTRFRQIIRPAESFRITLERVAADRITFSVDTASARIVDGTLAVQEKV